MPQWDDVGIVLSVLPYGEQSAVVRLLTAEHGVFPGMVKGALSKKNRASFQPGNRLHVHWQARLDEHLGQFRCELEHSCAADMLASVLALRAINAITSLAATCLPERINERKIYNYVSELTLNVEAANDDVVAYASHYIRFEMALLEALGFGLDLASCAATGIEESEALVYVSPKSGRAVCAEAGKPYHDKMLLLPDFLKAGEARKTAENLQQVLDGLALTGYFLESRVLRPDGKHLPNAREGWETELRRHMPETTN